MSTTAESDRGQALLLIPVGFLIVLILGSLVLEAAAIHLRQRQLDDLADSIANDAVSVGFDVDHFRLTGDITIDDASAQTVIAPAIAISNIPDATAIEFRVVPGPEPGVEVELSIDHEYIIGRNLLGGAPAELTATGRADLVLSTP